MRFMKVAYVRATLVLGSLLALALAAGAADSWPIG